MSMLKCGMGREAIGLAILCSLGDFCISLHVCQGLHMPINLLLTTVRYFLDQSKFLVVGCNQNNGPEEPA